MNLMICFFLCLALIQGVVSSITIDPINPTIPPLVNIAINTSGFGHFNMYYPSQNGNPNENAVISFTSKWMQYDTNKTLFISIGNEDLGDPVCINHFLFVEDKHYVLSFGSSDCVPTHCECVTGYGYQEEIAHYNSSYLAYVGRSYSYKYQREVDVYTGTALDGVGPLSIFMYIGTNDGAYVALNTVNTDVTGLSPTQQYYNEYFYNDVNMTIPDAKYFEIPQLCLDQEKNHGCEPYPFYANGTRIPDDSETTTGSTTDSDSSDSSHLISTFCQLFLVFALFVVF